MKTIPVSLRPDGTPQMHFGPRTVPFRDISTLVRVLSVEDLAIGTVGAPTQHQARHWEMHADRFDPLCPFCRFFAEGGKTKRDGRDARLDEILEALEG